MGVDDAGLRGRLVVNRALRFTGSSATFGFLGPLPAGFVLVEMRWAWLPTSTSTFETGWVLSASSAETQENFDRGVPLVARAQSGSVLGGNGLFQISSGDPGQSIVVDLPLAVRLETGSHFVIMGGRHTSAFAGSIHLLSLVLERMSAGDVVGDAGGGAGGERA